MRSRWSGVRIAIMLPPIDWQVSLCLSRGEQADSERHRSNPEGETSHVHQPDDAIRPLRVGLGHLKEEAERHENRRRYERDPDDPFPWLP